MPATYSRSQIQLHWIIAILMILQFFLHEGIEDAYQALQRGQEVGPDLLARSHVVLGLAIFALALPRVFLRLTRGAPPPPAEEPAPLRMIAGLTHLALFGVMLLMPVSGALAWFGGLRTAAAVHGALQVLMLAFVLLHVAGALYHRFVLRSDAMQRMTRSGG